MKVKTKLPLSIILPVFFSFLVAIYGYGDERAHDNTNYSAGKRALNFMDSIEENWGRVFSYDQSTVLIDSVSFKGGRYEIPLSIYKANLEIDKKAIKGSDDIICSATDYFTSRGMVFIIEFLPSRSNLESAVRFETTLDAFQIYNPDDREYDGIRAHIWDENERRWQLLRFIGRDEMGMVSFGIERMGTYLLTGAYMDGS